jgi:Haemolymph juvenile hormone binding protein (JHBP)
MKFFFAVCAVLATISPEIESNSIRDINEVIFHAFDVVLREEMRTGNPYTGFPIVAPFQTPEVDVSWKFGHLIDLDGALRTVRVDGLDGYHISDVRMSLLTMRFVFDFVWPQVLATGWYNLNGRFAGLIPIFGQGNYRIDPRSELVMCSTAVAES